MFDVIQGHWQTREVYLAGDRLNRSESLAVARHSPNGFGWGYGGSGPAQLALAILLRATDRKTGASQGLFVELLRPRNTSIPTSMHRLCDSVSRCPAYPELFGGLTR